MRTLNFPQRDIRYSHNIWDGDWHEALVCRRGHVLDPAVRPAESIDLEQSCTECGAAVLVGCTNRALRIRGVTGTVVSWDTYKPPGFCDGCGGAHPWATREQRIYELENILDQGEIEDADRLFLHARLADLRAQDGSNAKEERLWGSVAQRGKALVSNPAAQNIISGLVSAYLKASWPGSSSDGSGQAFGLGGSSSWWSRRLGLEPGDLDEVVSVP
jgi:hypothetical protein